MFVAQNRIKQQYPHFSGLFPTVIHGHQTLPKGSLQIIHTNNNHWVAVSTCNTAQEDFILYDSMYTSVGKNTRIILAKMITTDRPYFTVRVANITKQSRESDCGVYVIAFITHKADLKSDLLSMRLWEMINLSLLQTSGCGAKNLSTPSLSASFQWNA